MSENKNLPAGWGNDDEDDNYGYDTFDDESNEPSPWNTKSKKTKISESVNEEKISSSDVPDKDKVIALQTTPPIHKQKNSKNSENSESENESDFARTFAGIIVFLVLILAVSIGIMFLQKKDDNNIINTPIEDVIEEKSNEVTFYGQCINSITDLSKKIINSGVRLFEFQHVEDSAYKPTETDAETIQKTDEPTVPVTEPQTEAFIKKSVENIEVSSNAYGIFLGEKYNELQQSDEYSMSDITDNQFAIYDIDNDGHEELLLSLTSGSMASNVLEIYNCSDSGNVTLQGTFSPGSTFYENGTISVPASHNQGLAGSFWPYSVYTYNAADDSYVHIGSVDAWDKSEFPNDFHGNAFPDEYDTSNSGFLYYISEYGYDTPVDVKVYDEWRNSWIGSGNIINIDYRKFSEDNIKNLNPSFNGNSKTENNITYTHYDTSAAPADMYFIPESEGGMRGSVKTESGPLNLRAGASTNADVIVQMSKDSEVIVYGANNDWCYVYFYSDGMQYYGYASAQYIDINSVG